MPVPGRAFKGNRHPFPGPAAAKGTHRKVLMTDRLAEIKARFTTTPEPYPETVEGWYAEDVPWLIGEVERLREQTSSLWWARDAQRRAAEVRRLRGLLARLESAGQPVPGTRIGTQPRCPVCRVESPPHDRGCWLAAGGAPDRS